MLMANSALPRLASLVPSLRPFERSGTVTAAIGLTSDCLPLR